MIFVDALETVRRRKGHSVQDTPTNKGALFICMLECEEMLVFLLNGSFNDVSEHLTSFRDNCSEVLLVSVQVSRQC